jgi:FkbM family methyltransferase
MKIAGYNLYTHDFIPPIIFKIFNITQKKSISNPNRLSPFDSIPSEIEAEWVLDIGANFGYVSKNALISWPKTKVICFEPVASTFQILADNLRGYSDRVILFNKALSDKNGTGQINITTQHGANSIEKQSAFHKYFNPHVNEVKKETIELIRLDDIAEKFPTNLIDVLKIDVEGHELKVLQGGSNFISTKVDTIIIEIALQRDNSWENQSVFEIFTLLHSYGFCLINCIDLYHTNNSNLMLAQMDCIFRHKSKLQ